MRNQTEQYTDLEVIEKIRNGEEAIYEILIRRYNAFLYKIGRTYRYNHQDTEDLMQETYISAYFNLAKFENRSSFKTWLTRIMLNHCFQKKQKFSFQNEITTDTTPPTAPMFQQPANTEKSLVNKELGRVLENALSRIDEDYRIVFTLRTLNELSVAETMEVLDLSESNVKVRLNRAKKMLRSEIEKMYSPEDIFEFNLVYCDGMVRRVMAALSRHPA
ncbi:MAG TPA: sigma-70 family RNA polymerase sigma factor [Chryseolinea sp.]